MSESKLEFAIIASDAASRVFERVGENAEKMGDKAKESDSKFSKFGMALAGGATLAAGALAKGAEMVGEWVSEAAKDKQSEATLAQQLKASTGATNDQIEAVEKYITKTALATGVTRDELRPAFQNLARATGSTTKAQHLMNESMNVAAATHQSLQTITLALGRAYDGQVGGLSRLGIATKDAQGKTLSFKQIQAELDKQFGGQAAAAANTYEGRMARLKEQISETEQGIGEKLLPILSNLAAWFMTKVVPALEKGAQIIAKGLHPWLVRLEKIVVKFKPQFEQLGKVVAVVGAILGWLQEHVLEALIGVITLVIAGIGYLIIGIEKITPRVIAVGKAIGHFAVGVIQTINSLPGKIAHIAAHMWDSIVDTFKGNLDLIIGFWDSLHFTLPKIHIPGTHINIGGNTISFGHIPMLASGGTLTSSGSVIVGERGPELLNLPRGASVHPLGGGAVNVHVHVNGMPLVDQKAIGAAVATALHAYRNSGGGPTIRSAVA